MKLKLFLSLGLIFWNVVAYAQCSREDVKFFLDSGFSRSQITAICKTESPATTQRYEAYKNAEEKDQKRQEEIESKKDEKRLLKSSIKGWDVDINPKRIEYTHKVCVSAGSDPDVNARTKVCPEVKYRIFFKGLKILGAERRYLAFGSREIEVEGNVKRKILHDFKEYPESTRRQLLRSYHARTRKGATFIPVRRDYSLQQITEILRRYVREANES